MSNTKSNTRQKSLYEKLEVHPLSDVDVIRKAFLKMSLRYHPDKLLYSSYVNEEMSKRNQLFQDCFKDYIEKSASKIPLKGNSTLPMITPENYSTFTYEPTQEKIKGKGKGKGKEKIVTETESEVEHRKVILDEIREPLLTDAEYFQDMSIKYVEILDAYKILTNVQTKLMYDATGEFSTSEELDIDKEIIKTELNTNLRWYKEKQMFTLEDLDGTILLTILRNDIPFLPNNSEFKFPSAYPINKHLKARKLDFIEKMIKSLKDH